MKIQHLVLLIMLRRCLTEIYASYYLKNIKSEKKYKKLLITFSKFYALLLLFCIMYFYIKKININLLKNYLIYYSESLYNKFKIIT